MTVPDSPTWPLRADPRRMPLTAVDALESVDGGFVGRKRVTAGDPYVTGHFPALTVYPGVFLIESVHQMLELHLDQALGGIDLLGIGSARFSRPALAGDDLVFETTVTSIGARLHTVTACVGTDRQRYAYITATWAWRT